MKQLTGLDATFLHLENATQFGHVSGLAILTKPDVADYQPYAAWRAQLEKRLDLLPPLRRRLVEVPLGLDHPSWITTRTSTSTSTSATPPCRRPGATSNWQRPSAASWRGRSIAGGRCGSRM